jgi:hypothetical protein
MPARTPPRKIDGVVEQQTQPLFRAEPEIFQRAGEAAGARLQLAIAERAIGIDKGHLVAAAARDLGRDLGIDQVRNGVVRPANEEVFQHRTVPPCG